MCRNSKYSIFLLYLLPQATFSLVLQTTSTTTESPITRTQLLEIYNKSVLQINSTYNATIQMLTDKREDFKENVSVILFNPTSEIDSYMSLHQWRIDYITAQAKNQGTYRDRCLSFENKITNIPNVLKPEIVSCTYEVSNKTLGYYDNKNFSIPLELRKFELGIYYMIGNCTETDVVCLNYVLGYIKNCRDLVLYDFKSHQADINNRGEVDGELLDKCQMMNEALAKYDVYLDELAECLGVTKKYIH